MNMKIEHQIVVLSVILFSLLWEHCEITAGGILELHRH